MRLRSVCAAITAATAATAVIATSAGGAQGTQGTGANGGTVLKIGWAQNPKTLNPFVGQDEEDYSIWAINWDLLINYSPKDLTPVPGIAQSWEISDDKKSVTFHLVPDAKWSDGKPITSGDVKYSLQVLGSHGALFTSYTDNVT
jgi:peptide/nickel transport system substrate-binding protein